MYLHDNYTKVINVSTCTLTTIEKGIELGFYLRLVFRLQEGTLFAFKLGQAGNQHYTTIEVKV
jgi:hypothetical protein